MPSRVLRAVNPKTSFFFRCLRWAAGGPCQKRFMPKIRPGASRIVLGRRAGFFSIQKIRNQWSGPCIDPRVFGIRRTLKTPVKNVSTQFEKKNTVSNLQINRIICPPPLPSAHMHQFVLLCGQFSRLQRGSLFWTTGSTHGWGAHMNTGT